ncbi:MAG: preprotein translocase subunit SecE [Candidatus Paceibacterota bacterium]|jgi:preprotein translocase SecE subunit
MGFLNYIKETRGEMKHVAWPTRKQAITFMIVVIAISALVAILLGVFDFIFSSGLARLLIR